MIFNSTTYAKKSKKKKIPCKCNRTVADVAQRRMLVGVAFLLAALRKATWHTGKLRTPPKPTAHQGCSQWLCGSSGCTKAVTLASAAKVLGTTRSIPRLLRRHSITRPQSLCPCCSLAASAWQVLANSLPLDTGRRPRASSCSPWLALPFRMTVCTLYPRLSGTITLWDHTYAFTS